MKMKTRAPWARAGLLSLLLFAAGRIPVQAGDSLVGKVIEVKSGNEVTLDYGDGQYVLRLVGIEPPRERELAAQATRMVRRMVLGKTVRMRFEGRGEDGLMGARVLLPDPVRGSREVAQELVRAGLARRLEGFDFKYGELSAAESEARSARRGLWAAIQPR